MIGRRVLDKVRRFIQRWAVEYLILIWGHQEVLITERISLENLPLYIRCSDLLEKQAVDRATIKSKYAIRI